MVCASLVLLASPGSTNVIPGDPKVGTTALTRMWCFKGTVTFTMVGPGVSIVVGTTQAGPLPAGEASVTFTVPNVPAGAYTMVGSGVDCNQGLPYEVRVAFVVRTSGPDDPNYPPQVCSSRLSVSSAAPGEQAAIATNCFVGQVSFNMYVGQQVTNLGSGGQLLGTAQTGSDGYARLTFVVPDVPDDDYNVGASGTGPGGQLSSVSTMLTVAKAPVISPKPPTTAPPSTAVNTDVLGSNTTAANDVPAVAVLGAVETRADVPSVAASAGNRGFLARTGADALSFTRLALVIVAVGGVLTFATSRRMRRS